MQSEQKGIISNPNLAPYIKQSILAYQEANMLAAFYTGFCISKRSKKWVNLFPKPLQIYFNRRGFEELHHRKLKTLSWPEILRVLATRFSSVQLSDKLWEWAEKKFDKDVAQKLKPENVFFHGYEHACLDSLKRAKALGIVTFYEQPSQHHIFFTKIVSTQLQKYPELGGVGANLLRNHKAELRNQRRDEELILADYVICNSTFTKSTLLAAHIDAKKLIMIPYGYPKIQPIKAKNPYVFHFIYVGNLSLRKGIHLLLAAWLLLPNDLSITLTLVGSNQLPDAILENLPPKVKWIPNLPYESAQLLIAESNVLVLPTLADGFGMVISESMAMGVPVLTTEASAGPDLIESYIDGIVIPEDDVNAIKEAMLWCIFHQEECNQMGKKAQQKANAYPWSVYRENLVTEVKKRLNDKV
jgi:glycosyltransferase involved in cell wall biosynthesis